MSARRSKRQRSKRQALAGMSAAAEQQLIQTARRDCNACGSPRLDWMTVGEWVHRRMQSGEPEAEVMDWLNAFQDDIGTALGEAVLTLTAWSCFDCGHGGAFGPFEIA